LISSGDRYAKAGKYQEAVIQFRNAIAIDPRFAAAHYKLADAYIKLKLSQQAYQELLTTVELDSGNTGAQLELAALWVRGHKYAEAQRSLEKILAADPGNARAHSVLGDKYAAEQAWPLAIREFETAIALDSAAAAENYNSLAFAYASAGRIAEAEATLRRATEVRPPSVDAIVKLGQFYITQHKLEEAEIALRKAGEVDPGAALPRILLAHIYIDSGRLPEAERLCEELKRRWPDDPDAYGALAAFYEATGQKDRALAEFRTLTAARPRDLEIKARLASTLIDLGRTDEAAPLCDELLRANVGDPQAVFLNGRILLSQARYDEAKHALTQSAQSFPKSALVYYLLGVAESSLGDPASARTSFARALDLSPAMTDAAVALADLDARNGDYDEALRLASEVLRANPNSTLAYVVSARVSIARGNLSQAKTQLQSALDRDPAFLPALEAMLSLEDKRGRTEEAIRRFSALISQRPRNPMLHMLLAQAYVKQRDFGKAEANVKEAIAIDNKTPDAYGVLGEISRARGTREQAITWYKAAVEQNPKKVENHMALAGLYESQGNWEEARHAAESAHSLDPASGAIANNLAYLYLEHGGNISVALSLAQQAKQKLPDSPVVSDTLGWAFYKLGSAENAVAQLSESVRRVPSNPTYRYHLGMAYIAAGHPRSAAQNLELALAADPNFPDAASARTALHEIAKPTL
jgi:tetratricopeptide (TPR) repeat protein